MVDKNLFLYDLAVVAIMKNEEPYVKEWLAYNDAVKRFRFFCRYIAFIDGDEFIFPKSKPTIAEVVDEILSKNSRAGGLAINWQMFGSNNQEEADYSRGVLERFTLRSSKLLAATKTVTNTLKFMSSTYPHTVNCFIGYGVINETGNFVLEALCGSSLESDDATADKIVINHYHCKSREEYERKVQRGNADYPDNRYNMKNFSHDNYNDEFDDGILKYREARRSALIPNGGG